jgi:hypothetical protein
VLNFAQPQTQMLNKLDESQTPKKKKTATPPRGEQNHTDLVAMPKTQQPQYD